MSWCREGAPGHLWVEPAPCASSTPAMAQPQKSIPATFSLLCNSKRQGGGFGGAQIALMYPGRRFLVELATPGGLRSSKTSIIQSACNCFYTTIPPLPSFASNRANLATKLEPFQALSVLISGDWINLCKLRPQLQLHLHLKRQKTVGESFPRPTIYPLNRSIPTLRQPEHSCQDLNLTCEISILNSLA